MTPSATNLGNVQQLEAQRAAWLTCEGTVGVIKACIREHLLDAQQLALQLTGVMFHNSPLLLRTPQGLNALLLAQSRMAEPNRSVSGAMCSNTGWRNQAKKLRLHCIIP